MKPGPAISTPTTWSGRSRSRTSSDGGGQGAGVGAGLLGRDHGDVRRPVAVLAAGRPLQVHRRRVDGQVEPTLGRHVGHRDRHGVGQALADGSVGRRGGGGHGRFGGRVGWRTSWTEDTRSWPGPREVGTPGPADGSRVASSEERVVGTAGRHRTPSAPVAQRIERRPPEPKAQVRFLPGARCDVSGHRGQVVPGPRHGTGGAATPRVAGHPGGVGGPRWCRHVWPSWSLRVPSGHSTSL